MCLIFHKSCEPHLEDLYAGCADAKLALLSVNRLHRRRDGFPAGRTSHHSLGAFLKYLWDGIGTDPFSRGDVREFMKANNTLLYHLLDNIKRLPDKTWTSRYANDRPEYREGCQGTLSTQELLETDDMSHFKGLEKLRKGDTRTVIVISIDFKLYRKDYDETRIRIPADSLFQEGMSRTTCYRHDACVALALLKHSYEWALLNAESAMYIVITLALARSYPEICFTTETGFPEYRDLEDFDVECLKDMWTCFRHENADPIEDYAGCNANLDKARGEVRIPLHKLFRHGPRPKEGDYLDACLDDVKYGGDGQPWDARPRVEASSLEDARKRKGQSDDYED